MIKIRNDFDLDNTITCGQIFRFKKENNEYIVILKDRVISLKIDGEYIIIESNKEDNLKEVIYDYLDLNRDYNKIVDELNKKDKNLKCNKGLKMIHQYPLETVIEYIISQNNRVPSIANSLNLLSLKYGEKVIFKNKEYYLFPTLEKLKKLSIEDFRNCKVGFRDKYLYGIVNSNIDLNKITEMNTYEALDYLKSYKGIGLKVASCILLFAYQKFDVFPIDTWVKKYMKDEYNIEGENNIKIFSKEKYGNYSGLAIQYMFNSKRNIK